MILRTKAGPNYLAGAGAAGAAGAASAGGAGASTAAGAAAAGAAAGAAVPQAPLAHPVLAPHAEPHDDSQLGVPQDDPQLLPHDDSQLGAASQQVGAGALQQVGAASQQVGSGLQCLTRTGLHFWTLHLTGLHLAGLQQLRPASAVLVSSNAANARTRPNVRMVKPLVLFTAVFQPVGLCKVLENTSKPRWPLKTPVHAILTDRNLSNNLPNFPSFGPAVGGEANQILGNSLNFARLVDAGNDGICLCEQVFASIESVRMFKFRRGDSGDFRMQSQQVVISRRAAIPHVDSCDDKVQFKFFHPPVAATLCSKEFRAADLKVAEIV